MNFTSGDVIAIIALNATILLAVIGGIVRNETRMATMESLLTTIKEDHNSLDRRVTELEKAVWKRVIQ